MYCDRCTPVQVYWQIHIKFSYMPEMCSETDGVEGAGLVPWVGGPPDAFGFYSTEEQQLHKVSH